MHHKTPEGPGQSGTPTGALTTNTNAVTDVLGRNPFLQSYSMYPALYPPPPYAALTSLLSTFPPPAITSHAQIAQSLNNPASTHTNTSTTQGNAAEATNTNINNVNNSHQHQQQRYRRQHGYNHNNKSRKSNHRHRSRRSHHVSNYHPHESDHESASDSHELPLSKSKTVNLSLQNARGELESLVRWIGGDSLRIKHHCSMDVGKKEWKCVCVVPNEAAAAADHHDTVGGQQHRVLQTDASHVRKKDAIKIASKAMIERILQQPLPIDVDVMAEDGQITSIAAKHRTNKQNNKNNSSSFADDQHKRKSYASKNSRPQTVRAHQQRERGHHVHAPPYTSPPSYPYAGACRHNNYPPPPPPPAYDLYDPCGMASPSCYGNYPYPGHAHPHYHAHAHPYCRYPPPPPHPHAAHAHCHPTSHNGYGYPSTASPYTRRRAGAAMKHTRTLEADAASTVNNDARSHETDVERDTQHDENQRFLFQNEREHEHEAEHDLHQTGRITDDGHGGHGHEEATAAPKASNTVASVDETDEEYMNELKEEEVPAKSDHQLPVADYQPPNMLLTTGRDSHEAADDMKQGGCDNEEDDDADGDGVTPSHCCHHGGEEKELEGKSSSSVVTRPQRLLVLVPSQVEFKTIQSMIANNCGHFTFSQKMGIFGLVFPGFSIGDQERESMAEAPGAQNRLFIVRCGTGLVNVSMCIACVMQTVSVDAVVLFGSAISLQPKSVKPGHLLLANTVIQHDICLSGKNNAVFRTHGKLSQWLRTLITKGSGRENESAPVMFGGTILSGSEIIKSEERIAYFTSLLTETPKNETEEEENGGNNNAENTAHVAAECEASGNQEHAEEDEAEEAMGCDDDNDDDDAEYDMDVLYDDGMAVDRESAAVAIVCKQLRIPFCVLKSIAPPRLASNDDTDCDYKELYQDDDVMFDCTSCIPLIQALLKEYTEYQLQ